MEYISYTLLVLSLCFLHSSYSIKKDASLEIYSLHVDCKITSRFAHTVITTEVQNPLNTSREAIFDVELPKTAFITNFIMTVDNVTHVGTVKEKAEAKQQYQKAVSKGQSAGLVQSTGRKMEHFKISVNIAAFSTATFKLTYEELLKRYLGNYELYLRVKPKQLVQNFQINADIFEPQGIRFLNAYGTFITNELTNEVKTNLTGTKAQIVFKPTLEQQRTCPACPETLIDGDFIIKYDVNRNISAGNIQIVNGYFVHYFAPSTLKKVPKNVVFVIDRSGSMDGRKIQQTYQAFIKILGDIPVEDFFGIILFDDKIERWRETLVKAVPQNIQKAKEFVSHISARGGTNINSALLSAVQMLTNAKISNVLPEISTSIILFLSDGEPTSGTINHKDILNNIIRAIENKSTLYCLGFGNDVDHNFLEKLALENGGVARRIYEDSDSALQLQGFYSEVAYPLLLDVNVQYLDNAVDYLTQSNFRHYYEGSELIVAGHISNNDLDILKANVTAQGLSEQFSVNLDTNLKEADEVFKEQKYIFGDFTERLWAYLTIEQLLTQQISAKEEDKNRVTEKALNLSLKYNFVTPLTSMVVTTSEENDESKKLVANKPKEGENEEQDADASHFQSSVDDYYYANPLMRFKVKIDNTKGSYNHHISHSARYAQSIPDEDPWVSGTHFTVKEAVIMPPFQILPTYVIPPTTAHPMYSTESCSDFHVLITAPVLQEKICFEIDEKPDAIVNLIHDVKTGNTLNGQLVEDTSNSNVKFGKFGFINMREELQVEISTEKIIMTHNGTVKTYEWNTSFEEHGFLKKDEEKITVTVHDGVQVTIYKNKNSNYLNLFVEAKHLISSNTSGLLGQVLSVDNLHIGKGFLIIYGKRLPLPSHSYCDLGTELEHHGSCILINIKLDEFINESSKRVTNILEVPQLTPSE